MTYRARDVRRSLTRRIKLGTSSVKKMADRVRDVYWNETIPMEQGTSDKHTKGRKSKGRQIVIKNVDRTRDVR